MTETLKIISSALIVIGGGYFGYIISSKFSVRVKQIDVLIIALNQIKFDISFLKMNVSDAMKETAKSGRGTISNVFTEASNHITFEKMNPYLAFKKSMEENRNKLCLKNDEYDILLTFAENLGKGNQESENNNISAAISKLNLVREQAVAEANEKSKMWRGFGYLGGFLILILLF